MEANARVSALRHHAETMVDHSRHLPPRLGFWRRLSQPLRRKTRPLKTAFVLNYHHSRMHVMYPNASCCVNLCRITADKANGNTNLMFVHCITTFTALGSINCVKLFLRVFGLQCHSWIFRVGGARRSVTPMSALLPITRYLLQIVGFAGPPVSVINWIMPERLLARAQASPPHLNTFYSNI